MRSGDVLSAVLLTDGPDFVIEPETGSVGNVRLITANRRHAQRTANRLRSLALLREPEIPDGRFLLAGRPSEGNRPCAQAAGVGKKRSVRPAWPPRLQNISPTV